MVDLKLPKERLIIANASIWKRFISFLVDLLIIQVVIFWPFSGAIESKIPMSTDFTGNYNFLTSNPGIIQQLYLVFGVVFILIFAYFVIFEYKLAQTPGKMLMNLYLVPIDKKEKLTLMKVIIRNVAVFPIFPFSLLWIIDPLYLIFTGKRFSDNISKTQIIMEIKL